MKLPSLGWNANHVEVAADDTGVCNIHLGDRCVNYKLVPKYHLKRRQGKPKSQEYDQYMPIMRILSLRSLKCLLYTTPMHAICPVHPILLYFITLIVFIEEYNRHKFTNFLVLYQYNFLAHSVITKQFKTDHTTKYNRMYSSESDGCQHRYNGLRYHGHVDKNSVPTETPILASAPACFETWWSKTVNSEVSLSVILNYLLFLSQKYTKLHSIKAQHNVMQCEQKCDSWEGCGSWLLEHTRNEEMKELQISWVTECIEYSGNWKPHVDIMSSDGITKHISKFQLNAKAVCENLWNVGRFLFSDIHERCQ